MPGRFAAALIVMAVAGTPVRAQAPGAAADTVPTVAHLLRPRSLFGQLHTQAPSLRRQMLRGLEPPPGPSPRLVLDTSATTIECRMPVVAPDSTGSTPMPTDRPRGAYAHRTAVFGCTNPLGPAVRAPADTVRDG